MIWNGEKCDRKRFWVIQNGRRQPFCEKKSCVLIWNGKKCDRRWFSVIQNDRRQPFYEKNKYISKLSMLSIDLKSWEMRSKVLFGHPKWPPAAILWIKNYIINLIWREMRSKLIFGYPKWGGGGGGASQWPACKPFGIYTVFALGQIHQF